jgi:hypothetical protein
MRTTTESTVHRADWIRIPEAIQVVNLSRSTLYANFDISGGAIRTASVKRRGAIRGARMVSRTSLLAWIDSFAESDAKP